jgi:ankyrin repeat protein
MNDFHESHHPFIMNANDQDSSILSQAVRILLDGGIDPSLHCANKGGLYPIHEAVVKMYRDVVRMLISHPSGPGLPFELDCFSA